MECKEKGVENDFREMIDSKKDHKQSVRQLVVEDEPRENGNELLCS